jgi:hypothetical protein
MKYNHPGFRFWWLLMGVVIVFGSCQRAVHKPTTRTGTEGTKVAFNIKSALTVDQIASALLTAEATSCLEEISVLSGAADQFQVYAASGAGFPTNNGIYLVMSSGDATAVVPGTAAGTFSDVSQGSFEGLLPVEAGGSPNGHQTYDRASLRVKLSVPGDATTLSFDWKFGSEEPPTYFKMDFQDYFTAILELDSPPVVAITVDGNIAAGANLPGGTSGAPLAPFPNPNNTIYNSTTTGIRTALIDVTPFRGMTITLDFHVADASDFALDSGVFLDNLGFDTSCEKVRLEYAAKIICGLQKDPQDMRLARGFYATAINIHNPNDFEVTFFKKLALTYPPEEQKPGEIMPIAFDTLAADEALEVDCMDIQRELFPNGFPTPYIKGFVVIQSPASLDVTGVYTTASLDQSGNVTNHSSIDVEQIPERKTKVQPPEISEELDHFKVYEVEKIPVGFLVHLTDQFDGQPKEANLDTLSYFANPALKFHAGGEVGVKDGNRHLNWYDLRQQQPEPRRTIRFRNQFGQHSVVIKDPKFLLVPAQKTSDEGSVFPKDLDHYKCYEVISVDTLPNLPVVTLEDQFGSADSLQVRKPRFFCVPVKKGVPGTVPPDIVNAEDHLAVYDIPPEAHQLEIKALDQFGERALTVIRSVLLAVPSEKQGVVTHGN